MRNQSIKPNVMRITVGVSTLVRTAPVILAGVLFSASISFAGVYHVESPSVICSAHFNKSFGDFFTQTDYGYSLSFDEQKHATNQRWGYKYNGVLVGQNASLLLNWEKQSEYGIISVLDLEYPCRTTYSGARNMEINLLKEVEELITTNLQSDDNLPAQPISPPAPATVATPSESFTSSMTVATTPNTLTTSVSASSTKWQDAKDANEAQRFADEIQASIVMFMAISDVIKQQSLTMKDRVLSVVDTEITRLQQEKQLLQDQLSSRFSTPIRPNNANLSVSAFRAADTFPKIPFYVPGTNEIGEMLVVPRVSDDGYLNYQFDFLDPTSTYDKVRDSIDVAHDDIGSLIFGLNKVDEWTKVAQENNVNRRIEKTASCIPDGMCLEKKQGVSSTEVVFQVYEDGSTAGRIQRNKGKFMVGYNMSVESSILLSAYLIYMRDVGAKEFNIGVMTDEEVKDLFN